MMTDLSFLSDYDPSLIGLKDMMTSAVLIPLIKSQDGWDVLFEVRSKEIAHQPGDVCFPGGMREPEETPVQTAIRETCEELLIDPLQIEVRGPVDYVAAGKVAIFPFIAHIMDYEGTFSKEEVDHIFRVPLDFFLSHEPEVHNIEYKVELEATFPFDKIVGGRDYQWRKRKEKIYFYEYDSHVIWGLTAKILYAMIQLLKDHS